MSGFNQTVHPTSFSLFDSDTSFQTDADSMVLFVKRKIGDDVLRVELTSKQIWTCFEEATLEYGAMINVYQAKSQLANMLGSPTGSASGSFFPRQTLNFITRMAEPYSYEAGIGGAFNNIFGYVDLEYGRQDYNLYSELKFASGSLAGALVFPNLATGSHSKMRIIEVFQFPPGAGRYFNTSNVNNFLDNEFNFESYTKATLFYLLPVYQDILWSGMIDVAQRVRRSNYSYRIEGQNLRIFPIPSETRGSSRIYVKIAPQANPRSPAMQDDTLSGISSIANMPYGVLSYQSLNEPGKQWIRQFTLALAKELLGLIRTKIKEIPIPGQTLSLNGDELISNGREDLTRLRDQLKELLESTTYDKVLEMEAAKTENLMKVLRGIPIPLGRAIITG